MALRSESPSSTAVQAAFHVPDGNPEQLLTWLRGEVRPPALLVEPVTGGYEAVRITRLTAFWQDGEFDRLGAATRLVIEGVGRLGYGMIFRAAVCGGELSYSIAASLPSGALAALVQGAFEGAEIQEVSRSPEVSALLTSSVPKPSRRALVGVPAPSSRGMHETLLERLMRVRVDDWSLTATLKPADPSALRSRYSSLCNLGAKSFRAASRTVKISETTSESESDPTAQMVSALLQAEQERNLRCLGGMSFVTEIWLEASERSVDGLAALAAASLVGDRPRAFPVRVMKEAATGAPPALLLLPKELAKILQPPARDVRGLPVSRHIPMDNQPEAVLRAGPLIDLGTSLSGAPLKYPVNALTSHVLVSGTTGSGKSSFVLGLLHELRKKAGTVNFLVIEPTKDEYCNLDVDGLVTWKVGAPGQQWRLNPLEVPPGTPISTHIDLIMGLFASTFVLYPPLPYVLEVALGRCYESAGWDVRTGAHRSGTDGLYPTLTDLIQASLELVEEFGYAGEILHNVSAAIRARLGALTSGVKGEALDTDELFDIRSLLRRPVVVNLDLLANDKEKAFFMGLVLIRLWEARRGAQSQSLVHVTLLEEAHRILKEPRVAADGEGGEGGFASEMFGNLLAEVRSAGEGMVILDQSPRKLLRDVLTNTGLKVAFRTLSPDDRRILSEAMNIETSALALTASPTHEALVFWEGMDRPVRGRMNHRFATVKPRGSKEPARFAFNRDEVASKLADTLLRVRTTERARVWHLLIDRIEKAEGQSSQAMEIAHGLVRLSASSLARRRGWSRSDRDGLIREVLEGTPGTASAGWPDEESCQCAGGPGKSGCRVEEPVLAVCRRFKQSYPTFDPTNLEIEELRQILGPFVEEALGTSGLPTSLDHLGVVCMSCHLATRVRPMPAVRNMRERLRRTGAP